MSTMEKELRIDHRLQEILASLEKGISRDELADKFGHKDYRSLDMYMRRRGYTWDSIFQNYVPTETKVNNEMIESASMHKGRVAMVIKEFSKGYDIKTVATNLGFAGHKELANYMKAKGYVWSSEKMNYIEARGKLQGITTETKKEETEPVIMNNSNMLVQIPRYLIPGISQNKNVQFSHLLNQLVCNFSAEKNLTQKQIFENAIIEFLLNYGYRHEVNALFKHHS